MVNYKMPSTLRGAVIEKIRALKINSREVPEKFPRQNPSKLHSLFSAAKFGVILVISPKSLTRSNRFEVCASH